MCHRSHRVAFALLASAAFALAAERAEAQDVIVVRSPVGKQFLSVGLEAGVWLGSGTISTLPNQPGQPQEVVGEYVDWAVPLGPVTVGFSHVVAEHVLFELRLGGGATLFGNDRLVSRTLTGDGDVHTAWLFGAELIGRYVAEAGLTAGLGANISALGLPDGRSTLFAVGPRLGWFAWQDGYESYWTIEAAYHYPLINGLIPEFEEVDEPPIESTWHMVALYVGIGL